MKNIALFFGAGLLICSSCGSRKSENLKTYTKNIEITGTETQIINQSSADINISQGSPSIIITGPEKILTR